MLLEMYVVKPYLHQVSNKHKANLIFIFNYKPVYDTEIVHLLRNSLPIPTYDFLGALQYPASLGYSLIITSTSFDQYIFQL